MAKRQFGIMSNTYNKKIYFHEWAPEECSVDHIYQLLASLKRTHGWKPDVIVIDYMDLMLSRRDSYNSDDYNRQKHVATELRGLAKKENVLLFTATQTNRSGMDDALIDLNKKAESFGSNFALDYVISLNQSIDERTQVPAQLRMFIAKNRNGPKHETITCEINYSNMVISEVHNQLKLNVDKSTENVNTTHKRKS
jgi:replicative DNA helicase